MGRLPFTKDVPHPENTSGVSRVNPGTPIPRREQPLRGTKRMTVPAGKPGFGMECGSSRASAASKRMATAWAIAGIACAVVLYAAWLVEPLLGKEVHRALLGWLDPYRGLAVMFLLGFAVVCTVFSQTVSDSGSRIGMLVPVVFVLGLLLTMLVSHFLCGA